MKGPEFSSFCTQFFFVKLVLVRFLLCLFVTRTRKCCTYDYRVSIIHHTSYTSKHKLKQLFEFGTCHVLRFAAFLIIFFHGLLDFLIPREKSTSLINWKPCELSICRNPRKCSLCCSGQK